MSDKYLHRDGAPFGQAVWDKLDATVVETATARLAGRRLLPLDGPHGLALQAFGTGGDRTAGITDAVTLSTPRLTAVPGIESDFALSVRNIAAFEATGQLLDTAPAAAAALACARQEDELVFAGSPALGLPGLLHAKGVQTCKLQSWSDVGAAVENVVACLTKLDSAGFQGPYALALAPPLYNALFRRYPQGDQTEVQHLQQVVTGGVFKASALAQGGVVVTAVKALAAIVIGQDFATGFVGPAGRDYAFVVFESAVLRLTEPASVCVLK